MHYLEQITSFVSQNPRQVSDQEIILQFAREHPDTVLTRENRIAHLTASGFVVNPAINRVLLVHHNIYNTWSWTGGHADGDEDLLAVALREAQEETGAGGIRPLSEDLASLDILSVQGHYKRGQYVSVHLHLSASFVLVADEDTPLQVRPDENSGVRWVDADRLEDYSNEPELIAIYNRLLEWARAR